jgi:hypothetical protein
MALEILYPYANTGDKTAIPDIVQVDGSESWQEGRGNKYQLDPLTDPTALRIERAKDNYYKYVVSTNVKEFVDQGIPKHIVGKSYLVNDKVRGTDGKNYIALATTVTAPPSVDWSEDGIFVANDSRVKTALNASGTSPIYACRAWVNFNGTGVVAIRASGNVSSITDNGVGIYTVNFITAMPDVNYNTQITGSGEAEGSARQNGISINTYSVNSVKVYTATDNSVTADHVIVNVVVTR